MSFSMTLPQLLLGMKSVTRRAGCRDLRAGDLRMACDRQMGLKKGERPIRIASIRIVSVAREPIDACTDADAVREGFPWLSGAEFARRFAKKIKSEDGTIARIAFEPAGMLAMGVGVFLEDIGMSGRVIAHVDPRHHPLPVIELCARALGLQMPMSVRHVWDEDEQHRAVVLVEDGIFLCRRAADLALNLAAPTRADIVEAMTMDKAVKEMAIARLEQERTEKTRCSA